MAVDELKVQKCIIGTPLTLEEMLNPVEGQEIGDSRGREIVTTVQHELEFKAKDVMEVGESDDNTGDKAEELTTKQVMDFCQQMKSLSSSMAHLMTLCWFLLLWCLFCICYCWK